MWGINWKSVSRKSMFQTGHSSSLQSQEDGLIKHISFSFHDKPENLFKIIDTGHLNQCWCNITYLTAPNEEAIPMPEQGLGVAAMGPVGGGRLGAPSEAIIKMIPGGLKALPRLLCAVFANPNGCSSFQECNL